jgi:FkbM family methyltransferase
MSLPFLSTTGLHIHSFEPEPSTFQFLSRTHAAARNPNWHLHELALGKEPGVAEFHHGVPSDAAYAGLRDTGRSGAENHTTEVTVATLDMFWADWGEPTVSVIKIDVEGGEIDVFAGSRKLLATCRPAIISEIDPANYNAYGLTHCSIFTFIQEMGYSIFYFPDYSTSKSRFIQIHSCTEFGASLRKEINYLLLPDSEV